MALVYFPCWSCALLHGRRTILKAGHAAICDECIEEADKPVEPPSPETLDRMEAAIDLLKSRGSV